MFLEKFLLKIKKLASKNIKKVNINSRRVERMYSNFKIKFILKELKFYSKENMKFTLLFILSVCLFMQIFFALTWFPDELSGYWLLKRFLLACLLSSGYLAQYQFFITHFKRTCRFLLNLTLVFSAIFSFVGPISVFIFILILTSLILFSSGERNELA